MSAGRTSSTFFLVSEPATLMQGDIFVAPTTVLRGMGLTLGPLAPNVPPPLGESSLSAAWLPGSGATGNVPDVTHETRFGAVIVLSHECELEKDYNAFVGLRIKAGASRDAAEVEAREMGALDPFVLVAPLMTYDMLAEDWPLPLRTSERIADVKRGARVGYFPIPAKPNVDLPECVALLGRVSTVERQLLSKGLRLASLADEPRAVLRASLTRVFATRDISKWQELEAAIGQRILDVQKNAAGKKSVGVALFPENGAILHLEAKPSPPTRRTH